MNFLNTPNAVSTLIFASVASLFWGPAFGQADPVKMVDAFEASGGKFEGYRRSGAKGVCATGEFVGHAAGQALTVSSAFSGKPVPVLVRFSIGGGNPKAPDNAKSQRNLALQFNLPRNETWLMGNISAPVFGSSSPEQLMARLEALKPNPETKRSNPDKIKAFADANPETLLQGMREHRANALRVYNQDVVPFSVTYTFGASAALVRLVQHQHARLLANAGNHI
jgi:catalase